MKTRLLAILEISAVYAVVRLLGTGLRSFGVIQWELETLGWSYTGMAVYIAVPALIIWLTRRRWADYGVSLENWRTNLDIGIKAYLVRIISMGGLMLTVWMGLGYTSIKGGALITLFDLVAIVLIVWLMNRQKPVASGRSNLILTGLLLLLPILIALAMRKLSVLVVSTVIWQFLFSGFGEEFVWRGYLQSRLNQVFGKPYHFVGVPFGVGLILASLFFGLTHAFNTYDPAVGFTSLSWGWALWTTTGGFFFGLIREKTNSLLAPSIAHGLPDAVGEALAKIFGWL
jgi:membrane protease YdiL (CAAX protease family)